MNPVSLWRHLERAENHSFLSHRLRAGAVVIDAGANIGNFGAALVRRFNATVFAFEPDPRALELIRPAPGVELLPFAVAAEPGTRRFDCNAIPQGGKLGTGTAETIPVRTINLEQFAAERGLRDIALIKLDIEGAEIEVLDAMSPGFLDTVDQITVEFHDFNEYVPAAVVRSTIGRLADHGFACVKFTARSHADTLLIHRRRCGYTDWDDRVLRHGIRNLYGAARTFRRWFGGN